jgi:hypothetical protein
MEKAAAKAEAAGRRCRLQAPGGAGGAGGAGAVKAVARQLLRCLLLPLLGYSSYYSSSEAFATLGASADSTATLKVVWASQVFDVPLKAAAASDMAASTRTASSRARQAASGTAVWQSDCFWRR